MARFTAPKGHMNKKMNNDVYSQRRIVIDLLYKVKSVLRSNGIEMPRIDVRITTIVEPENRNLGVARMNGNYIWIPEHTLNKSCLYQVVLHELCHAIWGIGHNEKCKLMHPFVQNITSEKAEEIFLQYAKIYGKMKHSEMICV